MGGGNYDMTSSQFEVFKDEAYSRKGGCFVTTPKAIIYVIIALVSLVIVALLMYYYGPYSSVVKTIEKPLDIEKLLNDSMENISQDIRLPKDVRPILYKIKLEPFTEGNNRTLQGEVTIRLECLKKTKKIILNADKLNIMAVEIFRIDAVKNRTKRSFPEENITTETTEAIRSEAMSTISPVSVVIKENSTLLSGTTTVGTTIVGTTISGTLVGTSNGEKTTTPTVTTSTVTSKRNEVTTMTSDEERENDKMEPEELTATTELNVTNHKYDEANSKYAIKLKKDMNPKRQYQLKITFSSNISDSLQGLYGHTYKDNTTILTTHLQPIYARKVFPCFDEPSFKAPVVLTIRKRTNDTILSNTAMFRNYKDDEQKMWVEFEKTLAIPTYLLGFISGNLVKLHEDDFKPIIRIWGMNQFPTNRQSNVELNEVVQFAKKILGRLEKYFGVQYPLKKIDIVAVKDLRFTTASAGLILVKEVLFLNLDKSNVERKNDLFIELTKELTKEFIGNLVSINWWDDYWLVNGFSTFMLEEFHSELGDWDSDYTLQVTQETLHTDGLKSSLSLKSEVENSVQIFDISDRIKYNKGSCILRMLNASLAPLTFKKGVQTFIKEWSGNSTEVDNLWKSFDSVVTSVDKLPESKNVTDIMKTWITQPGHPLVTVVRSVENNGLIVNQTKLVSNKNSTDDSNLWIIPISYMIGNDGGVEKKQFWLTEKAVQISNITSDFSDKWILFNVGQRGYYRVNYGLDNWQILTNTLHVNYSNIPVENRGQLINDAFDLAEYGLLDYHVPFNLSKYLVNETHYTPWASALKSLEFIRSVLESTYLNGAYEDYISNLVGSVYDRVSAENGQDTNGQRLKDLIIDAACRVNYPSCTKWALEQLEEWIKDPSIKIKNRKTALCAGIRLSGRKEWEIMFERLSDENANSEIEDLYMALGCTKHLWLINRYLDSTLNGLIPTQYVSYVWQSIGHTPGRIFGFQYLRENWDKIFSVYKEKRLILKTIIRDFLRTLSSKSDKEDLTLFFGKHAENLQGFSYLLKGVVDRIDSRIVWSEKHLKTIEEWLSSHQYK